MYMFRDGASSLKRKGSVIQCRRYVCCTVVSVRVYPRYHGDQVPMGSVTALHCTVQGSASLCRRYVCCTVVSARVYPRYQGVQVPMHSVYTFSLQYTIIGNISNFISNNYARYTEDFCSCRLLQQVMPQLM
jgi:hypothetical protein